MTNLIIIIGIFTLLQIVNVVLNTGKALIMAKTDNKHISAIINAVTYGFYIMVVKQIADLDLIITVTVTIITNIIGVYITYYIADKCKKESLWKIEIYAPTINDYNTIYNELGDNNISYKLENDNFIIAYSYDKKQSHIIKEVLRNKVTRTVKHNVTEITKRLY